MDQYSLPKPSELFVCLTGGQSFTKLDHTAACQQMMLDEKSGKLVTVNMHQCHYQFCRLSFGVALALAIFRRAMDCNLQGLPFVICYFDDILVSGHMDEVHLKNLEEVLRRLKHQGIKLNREKCQLFKSTVEYLSHREDAKGVHTSNQKLRVLHNTHIPKNIAEVGYFLSM